MTRTPAEAVAYAKTITKGYGGECLKFVRTCFDVPAKYETAADAREHATKFHATSSTAGIPVGVPIFLGVNHVALYMGGGKMRTTNSKTGKVSTVPVTSWGSEYPLRGWSEDLNGVTVYKANSNAPAKTTNTSAAGGVDVRKLQRGLNLVFPAYSHLDVDGVYGPKTTAVVKEFQKRSGIKATGKIDAATKAALKKVGVL